MTTRSHSPERKLCYLCKEHSIPQNDPRKQAVIDYFHNNQIAASHYCLELIGLASKKTDVLYDSKFDLCEISELLIDAKAKGMRMLNQWIVDSKTEEFDVLWNLVKHCDMKQ